MPRKHIPTGRRPVCGRTDAPLMNMDGVTVIGAHDDRDGMPCTGAGEIPVQSMDEIPD
jgi:hypothetical protein